MFCKSDLRIVETGHLLRFKPFYVVLSAPRSVCWLSMYLSVSVCASIYFVKSTTYKLLGEFHQIYKFNTLGKLITLLGQQSKVKVIT